MVYFTSHTHPLRRDSSALKHIRCDSSVSSTPDRIVEPVFGANTVYASNRTEWYTLRFFDKQNYQAFGVKTDSALRVVKEGKSIDNLYCAGAGLAGFHPVQEGCGAGVSLLSALYVADQILNSK